jgi:hypothetical protein
MICRGSQSEVSIHFHCCRQCIDYLGIYWTRSCWLMYRMSKYGCFCWICVHLPLCSFVSMGISYSLGCDINHSTISNQLVARSIIVMHIKSITVLSLLLWVYGPIRSTHNAPYGVVMASFASSFPHLCCLHLFTWQLWHFLHLIGMSFWDLSNTSRDKEFPWDAFSWDVEGSGDTSLLHNVEHFAIFSEYFCTQLAV